jgi:hypothetical protein
MDINTIEDVKQKYIQPKATLDRQKLQDLKHPLGCEEPGLYKKMQLAAKYKPISLDFLEMRDEDGWPKFAVFGLEKRSCYIESKVTEEERDSSWWTFNGPPKDIARYVRRHYLPDVINKLTALADARLDELMKKISDRWRTVRKSISQTFSGIVPGDVKVAIRKAKRDFKNNICIVAEAKKWVIGETVTIEEKDPLVIGFFNGRAYLIADFDVTPVENYVKKEFTT